MNDLIQYLLQSAVSELTTQSDLLSLLTLAAGSFDSNQSRPLITGLDHAINSVIEVQNRRNKIEAHSTSGTGA